MISVYPKPSSIINFSGKLNLYATVSRKIIDAEQEALHLINMKRSAELTHDCLTGSRISPLRNGVRFSRSQKILVCGMLYTPVFCGIKTGK